MRSPDRAVQLVPGPGPRAGGGPPHLRPAPLLPDPGHGHGLGQHTDTITVNFDEAMKHMKQQQV